MLSDREILQCELLVVQCRQGDTSAFESIVRMWERPLFYYLRRLASSEEDAWDLLQETWLKTYRSLGSLRDPRAARVPLYDRPEHGRQLLAQRQARKGTDGAVGRRFDRSRRR